MNNLEWLAPLRSIVDAEPERSNLSLMGSVLFKPLTEIGDLDVYLFVPALSRERYDEIFAAAERCCELLGPSTELPWRVEVRRGAFKPEPERDKFNQLHLLIEDPRSVETIPGVLVDHYCKATHRIAGTALDQLVSSQVDDEESNRRLQVSKEFEHLEQVLAEDQFPYRAWAFDPEPALRRGSEPLSSNWMRRCFLKHTAGFADALYARVWKDPSQLETAFAGIELLGPQLESDLADWRSLADRWPSVKEKVAAAIRVRRERLSG